MKERPILFSGPMVKAILEGRKTQTRRTVMPQPVYQGLESFGDSWLWKKNEKDWFSGVTAEQLVGEHGLCYSGRCPYGQPGDCLWVRENFYIDWIPYAESGPLPKTPTSNLLENIFYRADGECCQQFPECCCAEVGKPNWRPSIHMPRWASRITLEITDVRVERIQQISEEDVYAEGTPMIDGDENYIAAFAHLWDSINEKRGFGWVKNPWVWVVEFKRV